MSIFPIERHRHSWMASRTAGRCSTNTLRRAYRLENPDKIPVAILLSGTRGAPGASRKRMTATDHSS
jgi:hypothetical protein